MNASEVEALAAQGEFNGKRLDADIEETHISWVLLTGRFAFKIKKPLKLSFLDFSTLPRRKKYCEKEVILNRRFSDIYLDVMPARYSEGRWTIGAGRGRIRDYAVRMKRLDSDRRMDIMLSRGTVTGANIIALAKSISGFHTKAEIVRADPGPSFLRKAFNDIRVVRSFVSRSLPRRFASIVSDAMLWSDTFLRSHSPRLRERAALGYKRDLHGDLHSGNIFLYRKPVIFDCIEFNDLYRRIDVIDEIAFFCMDMEAHGHKDFSRLFSEAYARFFPAIVTSDDEKIYNYFRCYRANVRAKVHALSATQEDDPLLCGRHLKAVRNYLVLMEEYMSLE